MLHLALMPLTKTFIASKTLAVVYFVEKPANVNVFPAVSVFDSNFGEKKCQLELCLDAG